MNYTLLQINYVSVNRFKYLIEDYQLNIHPEDHECI